MHGITGDHEAWLTRELHVDRERGQVTQGVLTQIDDTMAVDNYYYAWSYDAVTQECAGATIRGAGGASREQALAALRTCITSWTGRVPQLTVVENRCGCHVCRHDQIQTPRPIVVTRNAWDSRG